MNKLHPIQFTVNGEVHQGEVEPRMLLVDYLRGELGLTGTHVGCEHGVCGACTILLDGKSVRSCLMFAVQVNGHDIQTVESLSTDPNNLHPLQEAFIVSGAVQCGYCSPGMILAAKALLHENPRPTEMEVRKAIAGNLCRCGAYKKIVEAIMTVAENHRRDAV